MFDPEPLDTVTLTALKFGLSQYVSEYLIQNVDVSFIQGFENDLGVQLTAYVYADQLSSEKVTTSPRLEVETWTSAWQLWKHNHKDSKLFGWVARRWAPLKGGKEIHTSTVTLNLERYHLYPDARVSYKQAGRSYRYLKESEPVWSKWGLL